jgi:MYXO-CTERM domain-containing protein
MHRWFKHALALSFVSTLAACSAPSGCSALDGFTPLADGFEPNARIENAASLRITDSGFAFLEENLGTLASTVLGEQGLVTGGVLEFPIPTTAASGTGYDLQICPDGADPTTGDCIAEIDIATATLSMRSEAPRDIVFEGKIPLRLKRLPIQGEVTLLPIDVDAAVSGGGNDDCDPSTMTFATVDVIARLSLEVEKNQDHTLRLGYSMLRIEQLEIDEQQLTDGLHACGEGLDDSVLNALKGALAPLLLSSFQDAMVSTANQQLCIQADPAAASPCPNGTSEEEGICVYADGACASMAVGLEGHGDLGVLLQSFSAGTTGGLDFLLAGGGVGARPDDPSMAWGDLNPVGQGATLGLLGGAVPSPVATCVTPVELELPTGIPIPDEMHANTVDGWAGPGPHLGIALSERYVNYALGAAYNSGLLCIGASTEQIAQLSSGLFGLLVPSIKYLTYQKRNAPIAVIVRPQAPPTVTLGGGTDLETDPFVRVKLDRAMFDFYIWSSDRFIRAFTAQVDLDVPINLDVAAEGITPVLDKIHVQNASISNANLLREEPQKIAAALSDVVEGLAGQFLGELQPFDVSGALAPLGLKLNVPAAGIRRLQKDDDAFLGLFAGLETAPIEPASTTTDTSAELVSIDAPASAFRLATFERSVVPTVVVRAASTAARDALAVEYAYRLDNGHWHPWSTNAEIVVRDPFLRMQGHHTIEVRSRVRGAPSSEDRSPARLRFTLDVDAPRVWLTPREDGRLRLEAHDFVSPAERLSYRVRSDEGAWTDWKRVRPRVSLIPNEGAESVYAEVRDEEGNVASVQQGLIRGRPDSTSGGGTGGLPGCSVSKEGSRGPNAGFAGLVLLAGLGMAARRRKRDIQRASKAGWFETSGWFTRIASALAVMTVGGTWVGCNCLDDVDEIDVDNGSQKPTDQEQCGTWGAPDCIVLLPGVIGSYTSAAAASDGTVWVSGYNEADWNNEASYGDLVVGKIEPGSQKIIWAPVDGIPSEPAPDETVYDTSSWRGGQDAPGDDVGLWSSLALDSAGNPRVAYYDASNAALKFAAFDGSTWVTHTVYEREGAEAGRYAKLVLVGGKPVVAFQVIEASSGGFATSKVIVGRASGATPSAAGDWSFEDVAVNTETPCRVHLCPDDHACLVSTLQCTPTVKTCDPKCPSGEACIDGVCEPELDGTKLDTYPEAIGGYIDMAGIPGGDVGIVFYDRIHGNLVQARKDGAAWSLRVLDGEQEGTPPVDTGDMGIGASLFIDGKGDWHVAYVDGFKESLRYLLVQTGTVPHEPEVVDEGSSVGGTSFEDGNHVVGDDADVYVTDGGEVRIAYQDATVGELRYAVGTLESGASHTWALRTVEQSGFAGFFAQHVMVGSELRVANWWRTGGQTIDGNVRLLTP